MLLIDYDKCTGCNICTLRCSFEKTITFNPLRARINIVRWESEGIMLPVLCLHCEQPACIPCCPTNALSKNQETGVVELNGQICMGCKMCMMVCPFGGPSFDPIEKRVVLCDLCEGNPVCVEVCPTRALQYVRADRNAIVRRHKAMERTIKSLTNLLL